MTPIARLAAVATALLLSAGLASAPALPAGATTTAAAVVAAPVLPAAPAARSTGPKYSDPTYLPLRRPARVSCVKTNCRQPNGDFYHGDWAIDFLGQPGDPIMAAGYGVAHVGGYENRCGVRAESRGNWVWIDHGGGEVTYYYHMRRIRISDGQAVTPDTRIGDMGNRGAKSCGVSYLHFERRITNRDSKRVEPLPMWACVNGRGTRFPQAAGYSTWNMPKLQEWVVSGGTGCLPRPARSGRPELVGARPNGGTDGAVLTWRAPIVNPQLVTSYRVYVSLWHPSTGEWDAPRYYTVPAGTTKWTVPNLQYRRTYRLKVAAHDRAGASPWSQSTDVVIARRPGAPPIVKVVPTKRTIRTVWRFAPNGGNRILKYVAVLTRGSTVVRDTTIPANVREVTWTGLSRRTQYRVSVVAVNQVGTSDPSRRTSSTS